MEGVSTEMCVSAHACVHAKSLSHVCLFVTPWAITHKSPLSMQFSRQGHWVTIPSSRGSSQPRDQTNVPRVSCTGRWGLFTTNATWEAPCYLLSHVQLSVTP